MKPFTILPSLKDYMWGGNKLIDEYHLGSKAPIAEAWMLSCHEHGKSYLKSGTPLTPDIAGTLSSLIIKLIDAKNTLSLQVHPDDEYAAVRENDFGKTEIWYILDCHKDAEIVYGFSKNTSREEVSELIRENKLESILQKIKVAPGDTFLINPGTIHAIGAGILLCEVQQSSDITYRVYDYGRTDKNGVARELHISRALDVLNYSKEKVITTKCSGSSCAFPKNPYFEAKTVIISDIPYSIFNEKRNTSVIILKGNCSVLSKDFYSDFSKGSSIIIPKGCETFIKGNAKILITTAKSSVLQ